MSMTLPTWSGWSSGAMSIRVEVSREEFFALLRIDAAFWAGSAAAWPLTEHNFTEEED